MRVFTRVTLIFLIFCCYTACSDSNEPATEKKPWVKSEKEIYGSWILADELSNDTLRFKKQELVDSSDSELQQFTFQRNNQLTFKVLKPMPRCGNGMRFIDSCSWSMNGKLTELAFTGHYIDGKFENQNEYKQIKSADKHLVFVRKRKIKNEYHSIMEYLKFQ